MQCVKVQKISFNSAQVCTQMGYTLFQFFVEPTNNILNHNKHNRLLVALTQNFKLKLVMQSNKHVTKLRKKQTVVASWYVNLRWRDQPQCTFKHRI